MFCRTNHLQVDGRATHTGGMEQERLSYRFTGEVASRTLVHHPGSGNPRREEYTYTYDLWSRPLETWHSWNYGNSVLIADRRYDGAGRLALDLRNGEPGLRTCYTYNVRSWLTGVSVGASDEADTGGAFTQRLYYNTIRPVTGGNATQWAGNISGMDWQSSGTDTLHRYDYGYDDLSRLVTALYDGPDGDGAYTETYAYDRHGNITEIRGGEGNGTGFEYDGNRMILVRTLSAPTSGTGTIEPGIIPGNPPVVGPTIPQEVHPRVLGYDSSGRLSRDNNQGVKAIPYNLLGLPSYVQAGHQENETFNVLRYNASYGYSSGGVKLRRKRWTYRESGSPDQASLQLPEHFTDYVGSLVFEDNQLKTVLFEGGYVDATDGSRHFYITDHQGNIRAVTDATGAVEQTNDYRPFGGEFDAASTGTNPGLDRRYGGKEKDAALPSSPFYDFEARMYNPVYARFTTMDPMAEKYYSISPYAYCAGNPVNLVDPEGKDTYVFDENGQYLWKNEEKGEHRIAYRTYSTDAQGRTNVSVRFYEFADPINDPHSIDSGAISQLRFFSESDIRQILREQGADNGSIPGFAFNSIGGGDFDYAVSYFLSKKVFSAKFENGEVTSPYLFIPAGTNYAHNIMNLGNFFWAITGYIKGFNETILKTGADFNSIYLSPFNGYPSQPDSEDDQRSISEGVRYAHKHHLRLGL